MKKMVFILAAIFLIALASQTAQAFEGGTPTPVFNQDNPDYLRLIYSNGTYGVYSTKDSGEIKNNFLILPLQFSFEYVSPLIPVRDIIDVYWSSIHENKKFELRKVEKIWLEIDGRLPIIKRTDISQQGVLIGKKMFYQESFGKEERCPWSTVFLFFISYGTGLVIAGILLMFRRESYPKRSTFFIIVMSVFVLICIFFSTFSIFNQLAGLFSVIFLAAGEISMAPIVSWYYKRKKERKRD